MRLIDTRSLEFEEFFGVTIPRYAILSHTWGEEEVTFQDWSNRNKAGYKIHAACARARADRLDYLWVDTICIDKTNSTELSEAINSMFAWYAKSSRCYVYLSDLHKTQSSYAEDDDTAGPVHTEQLRRCRWFTRGWTLQELLAPQYVYFFNSNWQRIGWKHDPEFCTRISKITGIDTQYLNDRDLIFTAGFSVRMSWAARRKTTREEDIAYCLLGLFGVNMPLLYGEGKRAFLRFQEELIRRSNDQTIFCWSQPNQISGRIKYEEAAPGGVLAPHPCAFAGGEEYIPLSSRTSDYVLTNNGLSITLPAAKINNDYFIVLLAAQTIEGKQLALILQRSDNLYGCDPCDRLRCLPSQSFHDACLTNLIRFFN
ncbi:heterokaryon incompatibility protein-domain-containing protein [Nemania abortiva]|nr:heterokaryon incompatibility protein-domain-containing protein [Nemania abortiva]